MDSTQIIITLIGIGLIAFIVKYFFFWKEAATTATSVNDKIQEVDVTVKGGYTPSTIQTSVGKLLRLRFYRDETASCSEEVVFGDFSIRKELPAFQTTVIEIKPEKAGTYEFTCGMGMMHGKLVVV